MTEDVLYRSRPSMFRGSPVAFMMCLLLIPVFGLGLLLLCRWWLMTRRSEVVLTPEGIILSQGDQLHKVAYGDVTNVLVAQTLCSRKLGCGNVVVMAANGDIPEVVLPGLRDPEHIVKTIQDRRNALR